MIGLTIAIERILAEFGWARGHHDGCCRTCGGAFNKAEKSSSRCMRCALWAAKKAHKVSRFVEIWG